RVPGQGLLDYTVGNSTSSQAGRGLPVRSLANARGLARILARIRVDISVDKVVQARILARAPDRTRARARGCARWRVRDLVRAGTHVRTRAGGAVGRGRGGLGDPGSAGAVHAATGDRSEETSTAPGGSGLPVPARRIAGPARGAASRPEVAVAEVASRPGNAGRPPQPAGHHYVRGDSLHSRAHEVAELPYGSC